MENSKICFKCNLTKNLSEFYNHPKTKDGYLNKCKCCTKKDSENRRQILIKDELWIEKEKIRQREKQLRLNYKVKYKPSSDKRNSYSTNYYLKYPEKYKAKVFKNKKIRAYNEEEHHWSYNDEHFKDTIILSKENHTLIHRYLIYNKEIKFYMDKDKNILNTKEKHLSYITNIIQNKT